MTDEPMSVRRGFLDTVSAAFLQRRLNNRRLRAAALRGLEAISGGVGGGLQMQTDIAVSPSGDVWAMNNWQDIDSCFGVPDEALSTRCGGQGVTIFFGMAKPVRAPQIGPARAY